MKISQKQAGLLAREVHARLLKANVGEVSADMEARIRKFVEGRNVIQKKQNELQLEMNKYEAQFFKVLPEFKNVRGVYDSDSITRMMEKAKQKETPSVSDIEDKIILNAMFASDSDMESFIDKIVGEFTKKKKKVPAANLN